MSLVDLQGSSTPPRLSDSESHDDKEVFTSINDLPPEILDIILNESGLSELDKARAGEVCPLWSRLVRFQTNPHLTVFGKEVWEKYLGYKVVGEVPRSPSRVKVLETLAELEGKTEGPGRMLAFIPDKLTLNKLIAHMEKPEEGHATPIRHIWNRIVQELGDKTVDGCWVLFTETVINGSRGKSYPEQKELVAKETNSLCELPELIVAIACVALKNVTTGERILGDNPRTWTRCVGTIHGRPKAVGGFSSGGVYISINIYDDDSYGVVACRKF